MPTTDLILTIDLGSSSVRASAYRTNGERLAGASAFRYTSQADDGTFDPGPLTELVEQVISECLNRLRELPGDYRFLTVAWASFAMSWLGVDRNGQPVTPVYSYADSRSGAFADALRSRLQAEDALAATARRTGTPIHTAYAPAQMLRLATQEPERQAQVAHWQTLAAYLLARWQGRAFAPISSSEAGWTGLFNRHTRSWDGALLRLAQIEADKLPPVHDYTHTSRRLAQGWAERWPELADVPFLLAVGDGVGANLGSGCTDNHRIALTIGTTGAMRVVIPSADDSAVPDVPAGLWSYPIEARRWLLGGALTDGGSLYTWLHEVLAVEEIDELHNAAAALPPDGHGLTILPFLRGERAPGWATDATLTISGMTPGTTPAHLVRAAFEAVAYRFRLIYDRLRPHLAPGSEVIASGGALQENRLWRQILADVLQTPVHLIHAEEATSRGAAVLALQALGLPEPTVPPTLHTSQPDSAAGDRYAQAVQRQEQLYRRLLAQ